VIVVGCKHAPLSAGAGVHLNDAERSGEFPVRSPPITKTAKRGSMASTLAAAVVWSDMIKVHAPRICGTIGFLFAAYGPMRLQFFFSPTYGNSY
jgi:hypothetical protein